MYKYWEISKTYMKTQLVWRTDVIFNMLFTITKILFAYLLWGMVFKDKDVAGMFTFYSMVSYYITSSFLSQLEMSSGISNEIYWRIRNGTFSKYMVIPVGIEKYFLAMEAGVVLFYILFDFIAALVWVFIFQIDFTFTNNPVIIVCAIVITLLGLVFMVQLNYLLGIMGLKYQGIQTFLMVKDNLVMLVTGGIILSFMPFYYVTYLPSMLFTGFCHDEAFSGIFIILFWCIVLQVVINIFWEKNVKNFEGAGI